MSSFFTGIINDLFGEGTIEEGGFGDALVDFGTKAITAYGVSKLLYDPPEDKSSSQSKAAPNAGIKVQLPPATKNYLNVFYGTTWMKPTITDAKISSDNKTMWYVLSFSEVPDNSSGFGGGTISFGDFKWGDNKLTFDQSDPTKVISWEDSYGTVETKVAGNMFIYTYGDGSNNPLNSTINAQTVLSDSAIPTASRWTSSDLMSKTAFAIVKVIYNQEIGLTGLGSISCKMTNTITSPGEVLFDYFTNPRYGCGVSLQQLDTQSLVDLSAYSAEQISYYPEDTSTLEYANRYTINGMIDVSQNCFSNLQYIVTACDSWIQWNEIEGRWGVVINKGYHQAAGSQLAKDISELFNITDNVAIGAIDFNPTDLNSYYNKIEVSYPELYGDGNQHEIVIELDNADRSPNEPTNPMRMNMPLVNRYVQARYLATRKLIQNREDLVVNCTIDYSGIQIEAGDLVRVNSEKYQWVNKVFRVSQVTEGKDSSGFLSVSLILLEYNHQVYDNIDIHDFVPEANTSISNPAAINQPLAPTVYKPTTTNQTTNTLEVTAIVPSTGLVTSMDFYTGKTADVSLHNLYKAVTSDTGTQWNAGDIAKLTVTTLEPNSVAIADISLANPAIVTTVTPHNLDDGDVVHIVNVAGMISINGIETTVNVISPTTFALVGLDTTNYPAYTGNGNVQCPVFFSVKATSTTGTNATTSSVSSIATKFEWPGSGVMASGINSDSITNSAVSESIYASSKGDNDYSTNCPAFVFRTGTLRTFDVMSYASFPPMSTDADGPYTAFAYHATPNTLSVVPGDITLVNGTFNAMVHWQTSHASSTIVAYHVALFSSRDGGTSWVKQASTYNEISGIGTLSGTYNTSFPVTGVISGVNISWTKSNDLLFSWGLDLYVVSATPPGGETNYVTAINLKESNINITRMRK